MKFFGSSDSTAQESAAAQRAKLTRRSSSLAQLIKSLDSEETLCILDLGSTSPANIRYCTERGHKIYSDDLLISSTDPSLALKDESGKPALDNAILDSRIFLADNLVYPNAHFDVVLCWNLADYLDESLVKPVIGRLWSLLKPGGMLLAFFHTQEAGPDAPCYRYHIVGGDTLEMQHIARGDGKKGTGGKFRLQRVFNNRNIENLFRDFASIKFFLARDNVREVLVVR
jgi:SAM-dependent methyltransferase